MGEDRNLCEQVVTLQPLITDFQVLNADAAVNSSCTGVIMDNTTSVHQLQVPYAIQVQGMQVVTPVPIVLHADFRPIPINQCTWNVSTSTVLNGSLADMKKRKDREHRGESESDTEGIKLERVEPTDDPNVTYVNVKQYRRIIIRRAQRLSLVEAGKVLVRSKRQKYLHESRHRHAANRDRGPGGRFATKALRPKPKNTLDLE